MQHIRHVIPAQVRDRVGPRVREAPGDAVEHGAAERRQAEQEAELGRLAGTHARHHAAHDRHHGAARAGPEGEALHDADHQRATPRQVRDVM